MEILVTGGAGFVGSSLALRFKEDLEGARVRVLDNLKRRGSELSLPRLRQGGVEFVHGDVRNPEDLAGLGPLDLLLDCSAEPSVHAGAAGDALYCVETNLGGTVHLLELARRTGAAVIFLSTSRVYPIAPLRALPLERRSSRLELPAGSSGPGWSEAGIAEDFPLAGVRSLYGATKLSSEHLVEEYAALFDLGAVVNRCGVLAGPWQMGKVDQGFFALWAARHLYRGSLGYRGFGGEGLQVRDVLHVADLYDLLRRQMADLESHRGRVYNVGGGAANSVSLAELTELCVERGAERLELGSRPETDAADIPYYVSDNAAVREATGWSPQRSLPETLDEVMAWLRRHRDILEPILSP